MKLRALHFTASLAASLVLLSAVPLSAFADESARTVHVGYYELDGFQEVDESGNYSGYGYDYLQELAKYTGWKYEYAIVSMAEALRLLAEGRLDIVGGITRSAERESVYDYADYPYGSGCSALFVPRGNNKYYFDDYEFYNGMTVGVLEGSSCVTALNELSAREGFSVLTVTYPSADELDAALASGEIDAVASAEAMRSAETKIITEFSHDDFYFVTSKGDDELLTQLNSAMSNIKHTNPDFEPNLKRRYFSAAADELPVFTREESEYIASAPSINAVYNYNAAPLAYYNERSGEFDGISAGIFVRISEMTGLIFNFAGVDSVAQEYNALYHGEADVICEFERDFGRAAKRNVTLSNKYIEIPAAKVVVSGASGGSDLPDALPKGRRALLELSESDPDTSARLYDTGRECLDALVNGEAGAAYVDIYTAEYYLSMREYSDLDLTALSGASVKLAVGISGEADKRLTAVLDRAIAHISTADLNEIILSETVESRGAKTGIKDYIFRRPVRAIVITIVIVAALIALMINLILTIRRNSRDFTESLYIDKLTGVWSLGRFREEANERLARQDRPNYALIYVNIVNFKLINSIFGYSHGDEVLKNLSGVLADFIKPDELLARIDADRFAVLIAYREPAILNARTDWLMGRFDEKLNAGRRGADVVVDMGVYLVKPEDTDVGTAIDRANYARELHRETLFNSCTYCTDAMLEKIKNEKELEAQAGRAVAEGGFAAYYQPKVSLESGRIVGAEAFVRWEHADRGIINPDDFVELFERDGLIRRVDMEMFKNVCAFLGERIARGLPPITVSVNFSRLHLYDKHFCEKLKDMASQYGVPAKYLQIEITERTVAENLVAVARLFDRLREAGFSIAIDNFGSGYSSLSVLRKTFVDVIKIDKGFLGRDAFETRNLSILQSLILIGHGLGMKILCEGVETAEQERLLRDMGCDCAQGFYYYTPMPAEELEKTLDEA